MCKRIFCWHLSIYFEEEGYVDFRICGLDAEILNIYLSCVITPESNMQIWKKTDFCDLSLLIDTYVLPLWKMRNSTDENWPDICQNLIFIKCFILFIYLFFCKPLLYLKHGGHKQSIADCFKWLESAYIR